MRRVIVLFAGMLFVGAVVADTETINGVTWHYVNHYGNAVIMHPVLNSKSPEARNLPAAVEGTLPQVLTIPSTLGGMNVSAIGPAAIQVSKSSGVETIIVPACIDAISQHAIIGPIQSVNYHGITRYGSRDKAYYQSAKDNGLKGVLFLGNHQYMRSHFSTFDVVHLDDKLQGDDIIFDDDVDPPQYYYVEGVNQLDPYSHAHTDGNNIEYRTWNPLFGAAKVEIQPSNQFFEGQAIISLACTNSIAQIYYTIDGSDPMPYETANCILYDGPFEISNRKLVKALAYIRDYPYQIIYSNEYAFAQTAQPSFLSSDKGFHFPAWSVGISCVTEGAEIRYTLDGSEPTKESKLYTGPFTIDDTTTVKAKAFREDWFDSETAMETFVREWYTVDAPVIDPDGGSFANVSQTVAISCTTEDATTYFTTDGSDPRTNGRRYTTPFTIYKSCVVRAVAVKSDWKDSEEVAATFMRSESLSEAANFYGYKMETTDDAPWLVDVEMSHDGVSALRSGGDGSYLQTSVRGAGTLSFWWRAMCEEPGYEYYDYGSFMVGSDTVARIAGEDTGWEFFSTKIASTSKHVFRWEYHKDEEGSFMPDCIWIDQVQWTPADGSGYTLTTPDPVPYSWLGGYGLGVAESDYEAAAKADAANGVNKVWECYVAGISPTNATEVFRAVISWENGEPKISWEPKLAVEEEAKRVYTEIGKTNLTDKGWTEVSSANRDGMRFFKVKVEMK